MSKVQVKEPHKPVLPILSKTGSHASLYNRPLGTFPTDQSQSFSSVDQPLRQLSTKGRSSHKRSADKPSIKSTCSSRAQSLSSFSSVRCQSLRKRSADRRSTKSTSKHRVSSFSSFDQPTQLQAKHRSTRRHKRENKSLYSSSERRTRSATPSRRNVHHVKWRVSRSLTAANDDSKWEALEIRYLDPQCRPKTYYGICRQEVRVEKLELKNLFAKRKGLTPVDSVTPRGEALFENQTDSLDVAPETKTTGRVLLENLTRNYKKRDTQQYRDATHGFSDESVKQDKPDKLTPQDFAVKLATQDFQDKMATQDFPDKMTIQGLSYKPTTLGFPEKLAKQDFPDILTPHDFPNKLATQDFPERLDTHDVPDKLTTQDFPDKLTKQNSSDNIATQYSSNKRTSKGLPFKLTTQNYPHQMAKQTFQDQQTKRGLPYKLIKQDFPDMMGAQDLSDQLTTQGPPYKLKHTTKNITTQILQAPQDAKLETAIEKKSSPSENDAEAGQDLVSDYPSVSNLEHPLDDKSRQYLAANRISKKEYQSRLYNEQTKSDLCKWAGGESKVPLDSNSMRLFPSPEMLKKNDSRGTEQNKQNQIPSKICPESNAERKIYDQSTGARNENLEMKPPRHSSPHNKFRETSPNVGSKKSPLLSHRSPGQHMSQEIVCASTVSIASLAQNTERSYASSEKQSPIFTNVNIEKEDEVPDTESASKVCLAPITSVDLKEYKTIALNILVQRKLDEERRKREVPTDIGLLPQRSGQRKRVHSSPVKHRNRLTLSKSKSCKKTASKEAKMHPYFPPKIHNDIQKHRQRMMKKGLLHQKGVSITDHKVRDKENINNSDKKRPTSNVSSNSLEACTAKPFSKKDISVKVSEKSNDLTFLASRKAPVIPPKTTSEISSVPDSPKPRPQSTPPVSKLSLAPDLAQPSLTSQPVHKKKPLHETVHTSSEESYVSKPDNKRGSSEYLELFRNILKSPSARAAQALGQFVHSSDLASRTYKEEGPEITVDEILRQYQTIFSQKDSSEIPCLKDNSVLTNRPKSQMKPELSMKLLSPNHNNTVDVVPKPHESRKSACQRPIYCQAQRLSPIDTQKQLPTAQHRTKSPMLGNVLGTSSSGSSSFSMTSSKQSTPLPAANESIVSKETYELSWTRNANHALAECFPNQSTKQSSLPKTGVRTSEEVSNIYESVLKRHGLSRRSRSLIGKEEDGKRYRRSKIPVLTSPNRKEQHCAKQDDSVASIHTKCSYDERVTQPSSYSWSGVIPPSRAFSASGQTQQMRASSRLSFTSSKSSNSINEQQPQPRNSFTKENRTESLDSKTNKIKSLSESADRIGQQECENFRMTPDTYREDTENMLIAMNRILRGDYDCLDTAFGYNALKDSVPSIAGKPPSFSSSRHFSQPGLQTEKHHSKSSHLLSTQDKDNKAAAFDVAYEKAKNWCMDNTLCISTSKLINALRLDVQKHKLTTSLLQKSAAGNFRQRRSPLFRSIGRTGLSSHPRKLSVLSSPQTRPLRTGAKDNSAPSERSVKKFSRLSWIPRKQQPKKCHSPLYGPFQAASSSNYKEKTPRNLNFGAINTSSYTRYLPLKVKRPRLRTFIFPRTKHVTTPEGVILNLCSDLTPPPRLSTRVDTENINKTKDKDNYYENELKPDGYEDIFLPCDSKISSSDLPLLSRSTPRETVKQTLGSANVGEVHLNGSPDNDLKSKTCSHFVKQTLGSDHVDLVQLNKSSSVDLKPDRCRHLHMKSQKAKIIDMSDLKMDSGKKITVVHETSDTSNAERTPGIFESNGSDKEILENIELSPEGKSDTQEKSEQSDVSEESSVRKNVVAKTCDMLMNRIGLSSTKESIDTSDTDSLRDSSDKVIQHKAEFCHSKHHFRQAKLLEKDADKSKEEITGLHGHQSKEAQEVKSNMPSDNPGRWVKRQKPCSASNSHTQLVSPAVSDPATHHLKERAFSRSPKKRSGNRYLFPHRDQGSVDLWSVENERNHQCRFDLNKDLMHSPRCDISVERKDHCDYIPDRSFLKQGELEALARQNSESDRARKPSDSSTNGRHELSPKFSAGSKGEIHWCEDTCYKQCFEQDHHVDKNTTEIELASLQFDKSATLSKKKTSDPALNRTEWCMLKMQKSRTCGSMQSEMNNESQEYAEAFPADGPMPLAESSTEEANNMDDARHSLDSDVRDNQAGVIKSLDQHFVSIPLQIGLGEVTILLNKPPVLPEPRRSCNTPSHTKKSNLKAMHLDLKPAEMSTITNQVSMRSLNQEIVHNTIDTVHHEFHSTKPIDYTENDLLTPAGSHTPASESLPGSADQKRGCFEPLQLYDNVYLHDDQKSRNSETDLSVFHHGLQQLPAMQVPFDRCQYTRPTFSNPVYSSPTPAFLESSKYPIPDIYSAECPGTRNERDVPWQASISVHVEGGYLPETHMSIESQPCGYSLPYTIKKEVQIEPCHCRSHCSGGGLCDQRSPQFDLHRLCPTEEEELQNVPECFIHLGHEKDCHHHAQNELHFPAIEMHSKSPQFLCDREDPRSTNVCHWTPTPNLKLATHRSTSLKTHGCIPRHTVETDWHNETMQQNVGETSMRAPRRGKEMEFKMETTINPICSKNSSLSLCTPSHISFRDVRESLSCPPNLLSHESWENPPVNLKMMDQHYDPRQMQPPLLKHMIPNQIFEAGIASEIPFKTKRSFPGLFNDNQDTARHRPDSSKFPLFEDKAPQFLEQCFPKHNHQHNKQRHYKDFSTYSHVVQQENEASSLVEQKIENIKNDPCVDAVNIRYTTGEADFLETTENTFPAVDDNITEEGNVTRTDSKPKQQVFGEKLQVSNNRNSTRVNFPNFKSIRSSFDNCEDEVGLSYFTEIDETNGHDTASKSTTAINEKVETNEEVSTTSQKPVAASVLRTFRVHNMKDDSLNTTSITNEEFKDLQVRNTVRSTEAEENIQNFVCSKSVQKEDSKCPPQEVDSLKYLASELGCYSNIQEKTEYPKHEGASNFLVNVEDKYDVDEPEPASDSCHAHAAENKKTTFRDTLHGAPLHKINRLCLQDHFLSVKERIEFFSHIKSKEDSPRTASEEPFLQESEVKYEIQSSTMQGAQLFSSNSTLFEQSDDVIEPEANILEQKTKSERLPEEEENGQQLGSNELCGRHITDQKSDFIQEHNREVFLSEISGHTKKHREELSQITMDMIEPGQNIRYHKTKGETQPEQEEKELSMGANVLKPPGSTIHSIKPEANTLDEKTKSEMLSEREENERQLRATILQPYETRCTDHKGHAIHEQKREISFCEISDYIQKQREELPLIKIDQIEQGANMREQNIQDKTLREPVENGLQLRSYTLEPFGSDGTDQKCYGIHEQKMEKFFSKISDYTKKQREELSQITLNLIELKEHMLEQKTKVETQPEQVGEGLKIGATFVESYPRHDTDQKCHINQEHKREQFLSEISGWTKKLREDLPQITVDLIEPRENGLENKTQNLALPEQEERGLKLGPNVLEAPERHDTDQNCNVTQGRTREEFVSEISGCINTQREELSQMRIDEPNSKHFKDRNEHEELMKGGNNLVSVELPPGEIRESRKNLIENCYGHISGMLLDVSSKSNGLIQNRETEKEPFKETVPEVLSTKNKETSFCPVDHAPSLALNVRTEAQKKNYEEFCSEDILLQVQTVEIDSEYNEVQQQSVFQEKEGNKKNPLPLQRSEEKTIKQQSQCLETERKIHQQARFQDRGEDILTKTPVTEKENKTKKVTCQHATENADMYKEPKNVYKSDGPENLDNEFVYKSHNENVIQKEQHRLYRQDTFELRTHGELDINGDINTDARGNENLEDGFTQKNLSPESAFEINSLREVSLDGALKTNTQGNVRLDIALNIDSQKDRSLEKALQEEVRGEKYDVSHFSENVDSEQTGVDAGSIEEIAISQADSLQTGTQPSFVFSSFFGAPSYMLFAGLRQPAPEKSKRPTFVRFAPPTMRHFDASMSTSENNEGGTDAAGPSMSTKEAEKSVEKGQEIKEGETDKKENEEGISCGAIKNPSADVGDKENDRDGDTYEFVAPIKNEPSATTLPRSLKDYATYNIDVMEDSDKKAAQLMPDEEHTRAQTYQRSEEALQAEYSQSLPKTRERDENEREHDRDKIPLTDYGLDSMNKSLNEDAFPQMFFVFENEMNREPMVELTVELEAEEHEPKSNFNSYSTCEMLGENVAMRPKVDENDIRREKNVDFDTPQSSWPLYDGTTIYMSSPALDEQELPRSLGTNYSRQRWTKILRHASIKEIEEVGIQTSTSSCWPPKEPTIQTHDCETSFSEDPYAEIRVPCKEQGTQAKVEDLPESTLPNEEKSQKTVSSCQSSKAIRQRLTQTLGEAMHHWLEHWLKKTLHKVEEGLAKQMKYFSPKSLSSATIVPSDASVSDKEPIPSTKVQTDFFLSPLNIVSSLSGHWAGYHSEGQHKEKVTHFKTSIRKSASAPSILARFLEEDKTFAPQVQKKHHSAEVRELQKYSSPVFDSTFISTSVLNSYLVDLSENSAKSHKLCHGSYYTLQSPPAASNKELDCADFMRMRTGASGRQTYVIHQTVTEVSEPSSEEDDTLRTTKDLHKEATTGQEMFPNLRNTLSGCHGRQSSPRNHKVKDEINRFEKYCTLYKKLASPRNQARLPHATCSSSGEYGQKRESNLKEFRYRDLRVNEANVDRPGNTGTSRSVPSSPHKKQNKLNLADSYEHLLQALTKDSRKLLNLLKRVERDKERMRVNMKMRDISSMGERRYLDTVKVAFGSEQPCTTISSLPISSSLANRHSRQIECHHDFSDAFLDSFPHKKLTESVSDSSLGLKKTDGQTRMPDEKIKEQPIKYVIHIHQNADQSSDISEHARSANIKNRGNIMSRQVQHMSHKPSCECTPSNRKIGVPQIGASAGGTPIHTENSTKYSREYLHPLLARKVIGKLSSWDQSNDLVADSIQRNSTHNTTGLDKEPIDTLRKDNARTLTSTGNHDFFTCKADMWIKRLRQIQNEIRHTFAYSEEATQEVDKSTESGSASVATSTVHTQDAIGNAILGAATQEAVDPAESLINPVPTSSPFTQNANDFVTPASNCSFLPVNKSLAQSTPSFAKTEKMFQNGEVSKVVEICQDSVVQSQSSHELPLEAKPKTHSPEQRIADLSAYHQQLVLRLNKGLKFVPESIGSHISNETQIVASSDCEAVNHTHASLPDNGQHMEKLRSLQVTASCEVPCFYEKRVSNEQSSQTERLRSLNQQIEVQDKARTDSKNVTNKNLPVTEAQCSYVKGDGEYDLLNQFTKNEDKRCNDGDLFCNDNIGKYGSRQIKSGYEQRENENLFKEWSCVTDYRCQEKCHHTTKQEAREIVWINPLGSVRRGTPNNEEINSDERVNNPFAFWGQLEGSRSEEERRTTYQPKLASYSETRSSSLEDSNKPDTGLKKATRISPENTEERNASLQHFFNDYRFDKDKSVSSSMRSFFHDMDRSLDATLVPTCEDIKLYKHEQTGINTACDFYNTGYVSKSSTELAGDQRVFCSGKMEATEESTTNKLLETHKSYSWLQPDDQSITLKVESSSLSTQTEHWDAKPENNALPYWIESGQTSDETDSKHFEVKRWNHAPLSDGDMFEVEDPSSVYHAVEVENKSTDFDSEELIPLKNEYSLTVAESESKTVYRNSFAADNSNFEHILQSGDNVKDSNPENTQVISSRSTRNSCPVSFRLDESLKLPHTSSHQHNDTMDIQTDTENASQKFLDEVFSKFNDFRKANNSFTSNIANAAGTHAECSGDFQNRIKIENTSVEYKGEFIPGINNEHHYRSNRSSAGGQLKLKTTSSSPVSCQTAEFKGPEHLMWSSFVHEVTTQEDEGQEMQVQEDCVQETFPNLETLQQDSNSTHKRTFQKMNRRSASPKTSHNLSPEMIEIYQDTQSSRDMKILSPTQTFVCKSPKIERSCNIKSKHKWNQPALYVLQQEAPEGSDSSEPGEEMCKAEKICPHIDLTSSSPKLPVDIYTVPQKPNTLGRRKDSVSARTVVISGPVNIPTFVNRHDQTTTQSVYDGNNSMTKSGCVDWEPDETVHAEGKNRPKWKHTMKKLLSFGRDKGSKGT